MEYITENAKALAIGAGATIGTVVCVTGIVYAVRGVKKLFKREKKPVADTDTKWVGV